MYGNDQLGIIAALYIFIAIICSSIIFFKSVTKRKITIMSMCNLMYVALLMVVPAIIFIGQLNGTAGTHGIRYSERYMWTHYAQLFLTAIGYVFFNIGYGIKQKEPPQNEAYTDKRLIFTAIIFSLISTLSLKLYASAYGGLSGLLENANAIRAGWYKANNSFTFFKHFVPLSLATSWMLFCVLIMKPKKNFFFTVSVVLLMLYNARTSFIYIQANDGRMLLAVYILLFFIIFLKYKYEVKNEKILPLLLKFAVILVFVVSILLNADNIMQGMRGQKKVEASAKSTSVTETVTKEFYFIVTGVQNALTQSSSGTQKLMIGNDVVNGVFAWLPTSLKPIKTEDVWDYNTSLEGGKSYGQSPTSIVAQSFYDLSWLGIIIIPFIYGIIIKKAELVLSTRPNSIFLNTVYVSLGYYFAKGIPYFSFYNIMMNTFFLFLALILYRFIQRVKFRKG